MDYKSFYSPYAIRTKLLHGRITQYIVFNTLTSEVISQHKAWSKAYQTWLDVNVIYKRKQQAARDRAERLKFARTRL